MNNVNYKLSILLSSGTVLLSSIAAVAINYPTQVFDATYTYINPGLGDSTMRMLSDGKGHVRNEMIAKGSKSIAILDYPALTMTTLMYGQHLAMRMPIDLGSLKIIDEAGAKKAKAKPLGPRIMNGHPCHGYESKKNGTVNQVWLGDDIHCMVHSETNTPTGKIVMALKSFSSSAPAADLFQVPVGYKIVNMPQMQMTEPNTQK